LSDQLKGKFSLVDARLLLRSLDRRRNVITNPLSSVIASLGEPYYELAKDKLLNSPSSDLLQFLGASVSFIKKYRKTQYGPPQRNVNHRGFPYLGTSKPCHAWLSQFKA